MLQKLCAALLCITGVVDAQLTRSVAYRADLEAITIELPLRHPGLYAVTPEAEFQAAGRELEAEMNSLEPVQFYTRLQQLVSRARDAHTTLSFAGSAAAQAGFPELPVAFRWFADGVFVTGAPAGRGELLGAQLLAVGGMAVDEALKRLVGITSRENDYWPRRVVPGYLRNAGLLRGLGLASAEGAVVYRLRLAATGEEVELPLAEPGLPALAAIRPGVDGHTPVLHESPGLDYWSRYDAATRLLYVRYAACRNQTGNPYGAFADRTLRLAAENPVDTLVYDVRANGGGDSSISQPFLFGLATMMNRLRSNPEFRLFVLSDQGTFSSGASEVMTMRIPEVPPELRAAFPGAEALRAQQIGEPTGGKPDHWGEVKPLILPASLIAGQHSSRFFERLPWIPAGDAVYPDVWFPLTAEDYFARHDPHLAAALARSKPAPAPTGEVLVVNAASVRAEHGVAPGALAMAHGAGALKINGEVVEPVAMRDERVVFVVPAGLKAGDKAKVELGDAAGEFTVSAAAPGLFAGAVSAAARGEVVEVRATGVSGAAKAWIANQPAEVLGVAPVDGEPGVVRLQVRVPAEGVLAGTAPLFVAEGGLQSNGIAMTVR